MSFIKRITHYAGMGVMILVLTACSGKSSAEPTTAAPAMNVLITDINCPSLDLQAGTQVIWVNKGSRIHIVRSEPLDDGSRYFDSGDLKPGDSFSFTFSIPGNFGYTCSVDGSARSTIRVKP